MGQLIELHSKAGDVKTIWDATRPEEVAQARKVFNDLKAKRYLAYKVKANGEKGVVTETFDPDAEKIIMAPAMSGG